MGTSYDAAYNPALKSIAVVLRGMGRVRVMLISANAKGGLKIGDVSRELTRMSGRIPDEGLGNSAVDLSKFAIDGRVSVPVFTEADRAASRTKVAQTSATAPVTSTQSEKAILDLTPYVVPGGAGG